MMDFQTKYLGKKINKWDTRKTHTFDVLPLLNNKIQSLRAHNKLVKSQTRIYHRPVQLETHMH